MFCSLIKHRNDRKMYSWSFVHFPPKVGILKTSYELLTIIIREAVPITKLIRTFLFILDDIQNNDTEYNDIHHKDTECNDFHHNDTEHNNIHHNSQHKTSSNNTTFCNRGLFVCSICNEKNWKNMFCLLIRHRNDRKMYLRTFAHFPPKVGILKSSYELLTIIIQEGAPITKMTKLLL